MRQNEQEDGVRQFGRKPACGFPPIPLTPTRTTPQWGAGISAVETVNNKKFPGGDAWKCEERICGVPGSHL